MESQKVYPSKPNSQALSERFIIKVLKAMIVKGFCMYFPTITYEPV